MERPVARSGDLRVPAVIHLEDRDVGDLLNLRAATDALEAAFAELGRGEAATTTRVRAAAGGAMASAMAAVVPGAGIGGGKLYGTHAGGFSFVVALFAIDGGVLCTLDGDMLTRIRTAAATALAVRHLAPAGVRVAALFGTGNQSRWQARALAQELELDELRVWGRSVEPVQQLVAWAREQGLPARALSDRRRRCRGRGDVLVHARFPGRPAGRGRAGVRRRLHKGRAP